MKIDDIDLQLMELLQKNGRMKRNELAEKVGLSLPSASERLRKLEEQGYITGYAATLNPKALGKDITAFVVVTIDSSRHFNGFVEHATALEEVLECHAITGDGTHLLKLRTENTASLEKLLGRIQSWVGVAKTATSVVLSTRKETNRIRIHSTK